MKYIYFVSYVTPENAAFGFAEAICTEKITQSSQLNEIASDIKDEVGGFGVVILYYQLLRTEK